MRVVSSGLFALLVWLVAGSNASAALGELVLDADFPDPSLLRAPDGTYYAYATQTIREAGSLRKRMVNLQVARSPDGARWELLPDALPAKPRWAARTQNFWAPMVVRIDDRYVMYYSAEKDHATSRERFCVGIAESRSPAGPFRDLGAPLVCGPGFENIDPEAFLDPRSGRRYLYWGSGFGPIRVRELTPDGRAFARGSEAKEVLNTNPDDRDGYTRLLEGASVFFANGYYYLLVSGDSCCEPPHYAVLAARSKSPLGPFRFPPRGPEPIVRADGKWLAPGHTGLLAEEDGRLWLYFHAIDRARPELRFPITTDQPLRRVMLRTRLELRAGWPVALRYRGGSSH